MKTIKSLNEIKNLHGKVYVRWSQSINQDKKRGYSLRYGREAEAGLSCCEIDKTWDDWRILRQITEYVFLGGDCWIVTGDEVGLGGDDEPLLRNIKLIGKVSDDLLSADWKAMERDADIADYQERLTRITDPIGKNIIEKALNELLKG